MEFVKRNVWWIAAAAVLLAIGYFAFGSKAKASDVPRPPERGEQIVTAPYDWSGFVAGAHAGYAWGETSGTINIGPGFSYGGDRNGMLYGVNVGAQQQLGALVLGVEGSVSKADINGTSVVTNTGGAVSTSYTIDWLAIAEAKVGLAMGRWLPHLTAGGACGQGNATVTFPGAAFGSSDTWHCGWTAGGGLDFMLAQNFVVNVGYRYVDLGTAQVSFPIPGGGGAGVSAPLDIKAHTVRAGASLKF